MFIRSGYFNNKGVTLLEAVMAIAILAIAIVGLAATQGTFGTQTADKETLNCIVEAVTSGLTSCIGGVTPGSSFTCSNSTTATVSLSGSCAPSANTCGDVTVTATAKGKSFSLVNKVCNFS